MKLNATQKKSINCVHFNWQCNFSYYFAHSSIILENLQEPFSPSKNRLAANASTSSYTFFTPSSLRLAQIAVDLYAAWRGSPFPLFRSLLVATIYFAHFRITLMMYVLALAFNIMNSSVPASAEDNEQYDDDDFICTFLAVIRDRTFRIGWFVRKLNCWTKCTRDDGCPVHSI